MIHPESVTEYIMYSTVLIEVDGDDFSGVGTGFIFALTDGEMFAPFLVTNAHVIEGAHTGHIKFHAGKEDGGRVSPTGGTHSLDIANFEGEWKTHPTEDLCVLPLRKHLIALKQQGMTIYFQHLGPRQVPGNEYLSKLSPGEELLMVGYPRGIVDRVNYLPVFRRGITATHPATDFDGKPQGIIDAACLWGSSGSPIFTLVGGGRANKQGSLAFGGPQLLFLGVLYGGPTVLSDGNIEVVAIEQVPPTHIPIQLGYYVKSLVLSEFVWGLVR